MIPICDRLEALPFLTPLGSRTGERKKLMYKRKSKAERRKWWHSLTDEERYAYQQKKMGEKPKKSIRPSTCPIFPVIDATNRHIWQAKVLKQNPWLDPDVFEPEPFEGQEHMRSIAQEARV